MLYLHNRPRVDFATYALVTQTLPAYRHKLLRIIHDPREGRAPTLTGEQAPIKKAWLMLYDKKIKGQYDIDLTRWVCSCGTQKFHSYMLCKHLVQAVPCPSPDWWATVIRHPTWPFYNIRNLLSLEEQARIPEPEPLGNYVWLKRMHGEEFDSNTPVPSSSLVCIYHLLCVTLTWAA